MNDGHDAPRWLIGLVAFGAAVVVGAMTVLFLDLRHNAAVGRGTPPPAFVVVATPTTYGPPAW